MTEPRPGERDPAQLPEALEDEVLQALEQDDAHRRTVLRQLLDREPTYAPTIRRWLHDSGVEIATEAPGTEGSARDDKERIDGFRIVRLLGRGGFGSVHLAEPDDGGPLVAIKVLNEGMNSRDLLRRFAAEREALVRLDHPGIAKQFATGETSAGRPYFAMEYVPGLPLLVHCRRSQLPLRERLQLFLLVLDAVTHAHQRGIIHRDLSANNVLVAVQGGIAQPKIIDFGIAKSIAGPLLEGGTLTFQGTMMGTPEYMSPEQAMGQVGAIDTRTDVWSLGVQLYELLTEQLPIPSVVLRAQGIAGIAQVLRTHEPPRPSQIAPRHVQAAVRGDLDAIVMRAMQKDRDERYASAAEFAADLRRHLAHEPVLATTPSTWYLLKKFARRHRAQFGLAVAAIVVLVGALFTTWRQWLDAQAARTDLKAAHDSLRVRAEAGFRLLAGQQRLRRAVGEERALVPAWPARAPAMRAWLRDHGEPLRRLAAELDRKKAQEAASPAMPLPGAGEIDLPEALAQMQRDLSAFLDDGGTLARVESRLRFAEHVVEPALQRDAATWRAVAADLQRTSSSLPPQPGLVPLLRNPATGLHEFLDLASHPADAPLPQRDEKGELVLPKDCGIVFALVPRTSLRLGAQHQDPGMERYDPQAAADELGGPTVMLDDYFVARTELTRAQWARLAGTEPPAIPDLPQTDVDRAEAEARLREFGMELPTEAQWENACRAGTSTPWWTGTALESLADAANFDRALRPVAERHANAFGLFDVHGNAAEWCRDPFVAYAGASVRSKDGLLSLPAPIRMPDLRSVRGGSAAAGPAEARSSARAGRTDSARDPFVGLRPVRAVVRG